MREKLLGGERIRSMLSKKEMAENYDGDAPTYDKRRYEGKGGEAYLEMHNEILFPLLGPIKNKSVLEVCVGTGVYSKAISKLGGIAFGLDISTEMLKQVKNSGEEVFLIKGDAENLPIKASSMDAVICIRALYLLPNLAKVLSDVNRVLKPGGLFIFNFFNTSTLRYRIGMFMIKGQSTHDMPYKEMIKAIEKSNFKLVENVGYSWLPYRMFKSWAQAPKVLFPSAPLRIERFIRKLLPAEQAHFVFISCKKESI